MRAALLWYNSAVERLRLVDPFADAAREGTVVKAVYFASLLLLGSLMVFFVFVIDRYLGSEEEGLTKRIVLVAGVEAAVFLTAAAGIVLLTMFG